MATIPKLSSFPEAEAKVYLDFDGHETKNTRWNEKYTDGKDIISPAYENIDKIEEIWARVAEDFSPFNLDITTIRPPNFEAKRAIRVVIGGDSQWTGQSWSGLAYRNSWNWDSDTPAFVFPVGNLDNSKEVANTISHEIGHTLGLSHQSLFDSEGKEVEEYYSGKGNWSPIMGGGNKEFTTWDDGYKSPERRQFDLEVITSDYNGFGYRADDYGSNRTNASLLQNSLEGIIERNDDVDVFAFGANKGTYQFNLDVAPNGANLDSVLELWNQDKLIEKSSPGDRLDSDLETFLEAGTYFLQVKGTEEYGRIGQYSLKSEGDFLPLLSASGTVVSEGEDLAVKFSLTQPSAEIIEVAYETKDGSAKAGKDYFSKKGTLSFAPGETTKTIILETIEDSYFEEENFFLQLDSEDVGIVSDRREITIDNDDPSELEVDFQITYDSDNPGLSSGIESWQQAFKIQSHGGENQDKNALVTISNDNSQLELSGNGWKKLPMQFRIVESTVLEFEFKSERQGEVHSIGFDTDNKITGSQMFRLYGTQDWGLDDFKTYSGSGWQSYSIPVGEYFTGVVNSLIFGNDDDASASASSHFRNLIISQQPTGIGVP